MEPVHMRAACLGDTRKEGEKEAYMVYVGKA